MTNLILLTLIWECHLNITKENCRFIFSLIFVEHTGKYWKTICTKGSTENQYFLNCQQLCSGRGRSLVILSKCGTETLIICTIATKLVTSSNRGRQARALPVTEGWLTFLSNRINGMSLQGGIWSRRSTCCSRLGERQKSTSVVFSHWERIQCHMERKFHI